MNIGIYKITCIGNGKCYIGQSTDLDFRKNRHLSDLKNGKHRSKYLQYSYQKYGEESIKFEIIELCEKRSLNSREIFWIKSYDSFHNGFNSTPGGKSNYIDPKKFDFVNFKRGIEINCSIPELVEMYPEDELDKSYLYKTINGKNFSYNGWSYKHSTFKSKKGIKHRRPVSMTKTDSGETVVFESITAAANFIGSTVSTIIKLKKGEGTHTAGWIVTGVITEKKNIWKEMKLEHEKTKEIKHFKSQKEAGEFLGVDSRTTTTMKKEGQTVNGWRVLGSKYVNRSRKPIYLKSPDGKIYFFKSGMHFSRFLGVHRDNVKALMTGRRDFYKQWKRVNETELQDALIEFPDP